MVRKCIFTLALVSMMATTGAEARGLAEILQECGFGGMVFPKNPTNALISNLLVSPGLATTSGITTPSACKGGDATTAVIIRNSYEQIEVELAVGEGAYLSLLADLVKSEKQTEQEFVSALRGEFTEYVSQLTFAEKNRSERVEALYYMVVE
jgi:hypothetical protein